MPIDDGNDLVCDIGVLVELRQEFTGDAGALDLVLALEVWSCHLWPECRHVKLLRNRLPSDVVEDDRRKNDTFVCHRVGRHECGGKPERDLHMDVVVTGIEVGKGGLIHRCVAAELLRAPHRCLSHRLSLRRIRW